MKQHIGFNNYWTTMTQPTTKYYKFINVSFNGTMQNRDYRYRMGLNTMRNFNPIPDCTPNALYFTDLEHIHRFASYGNTLFEVSCPEDARIIKVDKHKYKTDKLVVERRLKDKQLLRDIYTKVVNNNGYALQHVPLEYRDYKLCLQAVQSVGTSIVYVPQEHKTYELCFQAVQANGHALEFIPKQHKTYELCLQATQAKESSLKWVPDEHKTYELCLLAVRMNRDSLQYVPYQHKTTELLFKSQSSWFG